MTIAGGDGDADDVDDDDKSIEKRWRKLKPTMMLPATSLKLRDNNAENNCIQYLTQIMCAFWISFREDSKSATSRIRNKAAFSATATTSHL